MKDQPSDSLKASQDLAATVEKPQDAVVDDAEAASTESDQSGRTPSPNNLKSAPPSAIAKFLAKLKEYKELIALIMFFVGGIIWLYAAFATKSYVASIRCLLGATIERVDNEAQSRVHEGDIVLHNARIEELRVIRPH
jgi:hypothetical protein